MKKLFLIIISFLFIPSVSAIELVSCGNTSGIPASLADFVRFAVTLIKYLVPVLIIVFGSIDFFKATTGGDSDMISKSFKKFGKKLIAGAIIFILVAIFQSAISLVSSDGSVMQCVSCFVSDKDDCTYYEKEEEPLSEGELTSGVKNTKEYEDASGEGGKIALEAQKYLGLPYIWGAHDLNESVDCSGFVGEVYLKFGYEEFNGGYEGGRTTTYVQVKFGEKVSSIDDIEPGDLIFYYSSSTGKYEHVAMYIGDGKRIHASGGRSCPDPNRACKVIIDDNLTGGTRKIEIRRIVK